MRRILLCFTVLALALQGCTSGGVAKHEQAVKSGDEGRLQERKLATASGPLEADKSAATAAPPAAPAMLGQIAGAAPAARAMRNKEASLADLREASQPLDRERYAHVEENSIKQVTEQPVSTFSIDVDTGAYANVRRMLKAGRLPPGDAVRVEEMINYFAYDYPQPQGGSAPFGVTTEITPTPWNADTYLLQIGIKGEDKSASALPPANLVFLVDVSGSMQPAERLPLLKSALKLLTQNLRPQDRVSIVVYAGASGVVLPPTPGDERAKISAAFDRLSAGGSTNGAEGIQLAYAMAQKGFIAGGINRVLLATDGDFNVGVTDFEALKSLVEEKRKSGVSLTTLGFGMGIYAGTRNYNEQLMEQLADIGNGNYAFIDTLNEARKVLVQEMSSTLYTIAKDVKIQVEFNPAVVAEYRLIGYENRALKREDFNNDRVDAGEIGAGHSVTALYEIALQGAPSALEPLRYQSEPAHRPAHTDELALLRLRYKDPQASASKLAQWPITRDQIVVQAGRASERLRFAAAVAAFGQLLKGGKHLADFAYEDVLALAQGARGEDPFGYRGEFIDLVAMAQKLAVREAPPAVSIR